MLEQLFPKYLDNRFHGHIVALWLFVPITCGKLISGLSQLSAPTTPVGLSELMLALLFLVTLLRYRSMIPLMYALLIVSIILQKSVLSNAAVHLVSEQNSSLFSVIMAFMSIIGFVFSFRSDRPLSEQF